MTDEENIEQAAITFTDQYFTMNGLPPKRPDVMQYCFERGIAWRDENPSPKVRALVEALEHYAKLQDWPMLPVIAKKALVAWKRRCYREAKIND